MFSVLAMFSLGSCVAVLRVRTNGLYFPSSDSRCDCTVNSEVSVPKPVLWTVKFNPFKPKNCPLKSLLFENKTALRGGPGERCFKNLVFVPRRSRHYFTVLSKFTWLELRVRFWSPCDLWPVTVSCESDKPQRSVQLLQFIQLFGWKEIFPRTGVTGN